MADDGASMAALASQICSQIQSIFLSPPTPTHTRTNQHTYPPPPLQPFLTLISQAATRNAHIFVHGVGREGLMLRALAMRLAHLGLRSHCVGDMNCPPITPTDLLIASAGPGGFPTVDAICKTASEVGAAVLLITAKTSGTALRYASEVAFLNAQTMADDESGGGLEVLPMGSLYEGAMFVLFEMVVFKLSEILGQSGEVMRSRHTNLE